MGLSNKLRRMLSSAPPTPEPSAASPAKSAWRSLSSSQAYTFLSTRYGDTLEYTDDDELQQRYREEIGVMASAQMDRIFEQVYFDLTAKQIETLQEYSLPLGPSTNFDWSLFNKYTPASFRRAFPELYI